MTNIQRVYIAHTLNMTASSLISVYIPVYLLTLGNPLPKVILFYIVSHGVGLLVGFLLFVPLMKKWGLINTLKLSYPLQIAFLLLLQIVKSHPFPIEILALLNGIATFAYWMPLNLLFLRHSQEEEMGSNFAKLFALPQLFSILGPLIAALLIPLIGFWPLFVLAAIGVACSFIPLAPIDNKDFTISLNFRNAWKRISRSKSLFIFEALDNIIEESQWFWGIYVYLLIGSLSTPGIAGSLSSIGAAIFTFFVGKHADKHAKKLIPVASLLLIIISFLQIIVKQPLHAYIVTIAISFALTFFLVAYFTTIYRTVKNDQGEEFIILREIPTVLGRMVVFGMIYLTLSNLHLFFITPLVFTFLLLILYIWKNKSLI